MQRERIEQLIQLASGCKDVIRLRLNSLRRLQIELDALDGRTCTGREYWRDKDHPSKAAKLYINHLVDQTCPLHGSPAPGERLRIYIGANPGRITAALTAIERETKRREMAHRLHAIEQGLLSALYSLQRVYDALGAPTEEPPGTRR